MIQNTFLLDSTIQDTEQILRTMSRHKVPHVVCFTSAKEV